MLQVHDTSQCALHHRPSDDCGTSMYAMRKLWTYKPVQSTSHVNNMYGMSSFLKLADITSACVAVHRMKPTKAAQALHSIVWTFKRVVQPIICKCLHALFNNLDGALDFQPWSLTLVLYLKLV